MDPSLIFRLLLLLWLAVTGASCRYAGGYVQEQEAIQIKLTATPSTAIYTGTGRVGVYTRSRFEGTAVETIQAARSWRLEPRSWRSVQPVVQPLSAAEVELRPGDGGGAEWVHGGQVSQLEFVTGDFARLRRGEEVVLKLTEESWLRWVQASQEAWLDGIAAHQARVASRLEGNQELGDPYVADVLVTERPLLRASPKELLVFFEAIDIEGGIEVRTRKRDPRYGWWAYELRPGVREALDFVARAAVVATVVSFQLAARCVRCR